MFSRVPGSTDCLNRYAGLTRYTTTTLPHPSLDVTSIDSASNEVLSVGDPAATIVQCEGRFFLAVVQINEICFDASSLLEINPRFLIEPTVTVQFQIFQVVEAFNDDPDIDGADWKWNRRIENAVMKTKGSFIQAISPAVAIPKVNAPVYFFRTDELRAIAAALFSSIPLQDHPRIPNLRKRTNYFLYRTKTGIFIKLCICYLLIYNSLLGDAAFICEVEQDERLVVGPGNPQPNHCNQCRPPVFWDTGKTHKILEHVAHHKKSSRLERNSRWTFPYWVVQ